MMVTRKVVLGSLLLAVTLLVQNTTATILPASSHYQGSTDYYEITNSGKALTGYIDFAVYDTLGSSGNEFANAGFTTPGTGQYIYVYQIFCDQYAESAIDYFAIFGLDQKALDVDKISIGSQDDLTGGITSTDEYFNTSYTKGIWEFKEGTEGTLSAAKHSWFLALSSDRDWVNGTYTMRRSDDLPAPPVIPEPNVLTLLGLGSAILLRKQRKFARQQRIRSHN
jgi:hypothetical protein